METDNNQARKLKIQPRDPNLQGTRAKKRVRRNLIAAKSREEAQFRTSLMERHIRDRMANVRFQLAIEALHQRILSSKCVADCYPDNLRSWSH